MGYLHLMKDFMHETMIWSLAEEILGTSLTIGSLIDACHTSFSIIYIDCFLLVFLSPLSQPVYNTPTHNNRQQRCWITALVSESERQHLQTASDSIACGRQTWPAHIWEHEYLWPSRLWQNCSKVSPEAIVQHSCMCIHGALQSLFWPL